MPCRFGHEHGCSRKGRHSGLGMDALLKRARAKRTSGHGRTAETIARGEAVVRVGARMQC